MSELITNDAIEEAAARALVSQHWDGTGCGTHGTNACVNCFGPSPYTAREVAREVLREAVPLIEARVREETLLATRAELQAAYRSGPGNNLQGKPETWRKGMARAHRIVRDFQQGLTKEATR